MCIECGSETLNGAEEIALSGWKPVYQSRGSWLSKGILRVFTDLRDAQSGPPYSEYNLYMYVMM